MLIRVLCFVLFLLSSIAGSGQSNDSLLFVDLLKRGQALEPVDRDSAMTLFKMTLTWADSAGIDNQEIARICSKLANYEYYRGNTEVAVTLALRAQESYELNGDIKHAIQMQILVGDILRGNELLNQSQEYLRNALTKSIELNDSTLIRYAYNRLAALGIDDVRIPHDSTEKFAGISLQIARAQQNDTMIYNNLNILGVLETMRKDYKKSLEYLNEALTVARAIFPEDEPLILHNMARDNFQLGLTDQAVDLDKRAFQLAQQMNIPQYVRLASSHLKDYYISIGNYKDGLYYAVKYYQAKDFILTQKVLVQVKEFNNRIEAEKQRLENQKLLYENKLKDGRMRTFLAIGILLAILLIITTVFMFNQRRQRLKIREIASRLDQSNTVLKRFISVLGHDLRSPFNAILGFTELLKNESSLTAEDREMAIDRLYYVSRSTHKLLERILEWSQLQSGSIKPVMKRCNLLDLVQETIHILEPNARLKNIEIINQVQSPYEIMADENMILTVIRNLLSNAIKFSHPGSHIEIGLTQKERQTVLYILDHGTGISPQNISRLFHPDDSYKSQGTAGESGTGLGLILCKEYLGLHGWKLEVESEEGMGSTFSVVIV